MTPTPAPPADSAAANLAAWQAAGETFEHRGHTVFYVRGGDWADTTKPVLMLIHGFPTASWDWCHQWTALCQRFRVVAPDMLGFGFSDKPQDDGYRLHDQADLHVELLAHLGIDSAHVLAHDYGDTVAQELLAQHAEGRVRLQSVCFLNGGLIPDQHRPRLIQKLLHTPLGPLITRAMGRGQFARSFAAVFGPDTQPSEQLLDECWQLVTHNDGLRVFHILIRYMAQRKQHRSRWVGALTATDVPLRLIDGVQDPVSGGHLADAYEQQVPGADVVRLNVGHYPQLEAPDAVLEHYLAFVTPLLG